MHKFIIFAIDHNDTRTAWFEDWFKLQACKTGNLVICEGSWEGINERSYIVNRHDFELIKAGGWVDEQVCVLSVSSCNKQYAALEYPCGKLEPVGSMHSVTKEEALASVGYTYRPDLNVYWVAKEGNPDNAYRESRERRDAGWYDKTAAA